MPKLVHKDKVERQKSWNYTKRHDKLQKNLREGKLYTSKAKALYDAGYKDVDSIDNSKGVQELIKEWRLPHIAVINFKRAATIEEDADRDTRENVTLKVKASELILKLSGDLTEKREVTNKFDIKEQDKQTLQNAFGNLVQGVHTEDDKDTDNEPVS